MPKELNISEDATQTEEQERGSTSKVEKATSLAKDSLTPQFYLATKALSLVKSPMSARYLARFIVLTMLLVALALIFVPWQQTVYGSGSVTSFVPGVRPQAVESPINGRIIKWHYNEGDKVRKGDTLVELQDLNTSFMSEELLLRMKEVYEGTVASQEFAIQVATEKLEQMRQKFESSRAAADNAVVDAEVATIQLERAEVLLRDGLAAQRDLEVAQLRRQKAIADSVRAFRTLEADRRAVIEAENYQEETRAKARAEINKALLSIENASMRRGAGVLTAASTGTLVRVQKPGLGETVKEGDMLAQILPASNDQAVELYISSRDAAIVDPGREVRLQFSGFPAFIFSGWSNFSINTFGGKVAVVDAVDTEKGYYRVLIVPSEEWPSQRFLRQGTPTNGWILLEEVSVGFEIWRQLNGFPPILPSPVKTGLSASVKK